MESYEYGSLCGGLFVFVFYILSIAWVHSDAESRGKTGCLWVLIVFFTWPLGLIAYYMLRDQDVRL